MLIPPLHNHQQPTQNTTYSDTTTTKTQYIVFIIQRTHNHHRKIVQHSQNQKSFFVQKVENEKSVLTDGAVGAILFTAVTAYTATNTKIILKCSYAVE